MRKCGTAAAVELTCPGVPVMAWASLWPSVAMCGVCLATAALFQPYWIGALGALVATAAERHRPRLLTLWDDNLHLVAMSLAVMGALVMVLGV